MPIRVLIVEDSPTQRHQLVSLIQEAPDMAVIGQARDGLEALQLVEKLRPDVISMDLKMPNLGGIEATRQIMGHFPTPIVIVTSVGHDSDLAAQAVHAGALAAVDKPPVSHHPEFAIRRNELLSTLRLMAGVKVITRHNTGRLVLPPTIPEHDKTVPEVVAIGASAGGPNALAVLLGSIPNNFSLPIVIVQHINAEFVNGLVGWLQRISPLPVKLAVHDEPVVEGHVYLAPGGTHLQVSPQRRLMLDFTHGTYRHQPAVDVLFDSIASVYGVNAVGILLTGMGDDGAVGLLAMHQVGARTLVQDEESCVVFGMPAAALALNAAEFVLPLDRIGSALIELCGKD